MKYFAKYIPVEGRLMVGGLYWNKQHKTADLVSSSLHLDVLHRGDFQPVKLFLCSRDIKVGDKLTGWSGKTTHIAVKQDEDLFKTSGIDSHVFKVMGEISPDAIWVKEGDEFNDEQVKIDLRQDYSKFDPWYADKSLEYFYRIKCPTCNTFH